MFVKRLQYAFLISALACFCISPPVHAYLDPGTGSYVFQLLLASIVGLAFIVRVFWSRIKASVSRLFSRSKGETGEENGE
jgi:hypothetical protein